MGREKSAVVERSSKLLVSLMNIALSPVLQLPDITVEQSNALATQARIVDVKSFVKGESQKKREILSDLGDKKLARIERIAQNWPSLELVDAKFQVVGEKIVTPGSFVQLIVKVKITPPSSLNVPE